MTLTQIIWEEVALAGKAVAIFITPTVTELIQLQVNPQVGQPGCIL